MRSPIKLLDSLESYDSYDSLESHDSYDSQNDRSDQSARHNTNSPTINDVGLEVGRTLARLSRVIDHTCEEKGITSAQYRALLLVDQRPQRAFELAARMEVRRPTLSAIIQGLERSGLLNRVQAPEDGRGITLKLTPSGKAVLNDTDQLIAKVFEGLFRLSGIDPDGLEKSLSRLLEIVDQACIDGGKL